MRSRDGADGVKALTADLVVDATGRGSRCAAWLNALGQAAPREEKIEVGVGYMTRLYRRRPEQLNGKFGALFAASRPDWRVGFIVAQEGERWTVTLGGYLGDHPPADEEGFLEFARSSKTGHLSGHPGGGEVVPLMPYRFGTNCGRHYAELDRFPQGFLVYGDALRASIRSTARDDGRHYGIPRPAPMPGGRHSDIARRFSGPPTASSTSLGKSRSGATCNTRACRANARCRCASSIGTLPSCSGLRKPMSC